jgi:hypothetical protein
MNTAKYRTKPCRNYHGPVGCNRGENCHFIHDTEYEGTEIPNFNPMKYRNQPISGGNPTNLEKNNSLEDVSMESSIPQVSNNPPQMTNFPPHGMNVNQQRPRFNNNQPMNPMFMNQNPNFHRNVQPQMRPVGNNMMPNMPNMPNMMGQPNLSMPNMGAQNPPQPSQTPPPNMMLGGFNNPQMRWPYGMNLNMMPNFTTPQNSGQPNNEPK